MFVVLPNSSTLFSAVVLHHDDQHEMLESIRETVYILQDAAQEDSSSTEHLLNIKMWSGHVPFLCMYGINIAHDMQTRLHPDKRTGTEYFVQDTCSECQSTQYIRSWIDTFDGFATSAIEDSGMGVFDAPLWALRKEVNLAHQAYLISLRPEWYRSIFGFIRPLATPVPPEGESVYETTLENMAL